MFNKSLVLDPLSIDTTSESDDVISMPGYCLYSKELAWNAGKNLWRLRVHLSSKSTYISLCRLSLTNFYQDSSNARTDVEWVFLWLFYMDIHMKMDAAPATVLSYLREILRNRFSQCRLAVRRDLMQWVLSYLTSCLTRCVMIKYISLKFAWTLFVITYIFKRMTLYVTSRVSMQYDLRSKDRSWNINRNRP